MGFFKKMFEKKECSICGGEIGLLGNRKLEDGNCCKECAKKLSPWFDERRHSTVEQIKQQLQYREQNQAALAGFRPTLVFGERFTLRAELVNAVPTRFVVERTDNYKTENADIVNFKDVVSFNIDERQHEHELKRRNDKGEEISYNPPRFEYSYDFYAEITVNHPYFDDMRFQLNRSTIRLETVGRRVGVFGVDRSSFDPTLYPEYREARAWWDTMNEMFNAGMQGRQMVTGTQQPAYGQPMQQPAYGQPAQQPAYGQPAQQPAYGQPAQQPAYGQPAQQPAYGQPAQQPAYGQPAQQPAYGQPAQQPAYDQPAQQPAVPVQPAAPVAAGPKFCPNCGTPADGGKFCQNCGSPL